MKVGLLRWMGRICPRWLGSGSFCAHFSLRFLRCQVLDSMNLSRFGTKVVFRTSNAYGYVAKLTSRTTSQFFMVSLHCMWLYDYLLTLGDEVWHACIFRPRRHVLTVVQIKYAWSGRKSWGGFVSTSPRILTTYTVARQDSRCSFLYDISKGLKLR